MVFRVRGLDPDMRAESQVTRPTCAKFFFRRLFNSHFWNVAPFLSAPSPIVIRRSVTRKLFKFKTMIHFRFVVQGDWMREHSPNHLTSSSAHISCSEHAWEVLIWNSTSAQLGIDRNLSKNGQFQVILLRCICAACMCVRQWLASDQSLCRSNTAYPVLGFGFS